MQPKTQRGANHRQNTWAPRATKMVKDSENRKAPADLAEGRHGAVDHLCFQLPLERALKDTAVGHRPAKRKQQPPGRAPAAPK
jgi:hypothetical protein